MPTLVAHTKNGFKNMPARGLCDSCTDADYMALIKLMSE
jgi:cytochrome c5